MSHTHTEKHILIIDDDPIARMLAKRNLEIAGFKGSITSADNGQVGFDVIRRSSVDFIVLLDFHMPELDGLGFLQKLKDHGLEMPVFMLSSSIMSQNQSMCLSYPGVRNFFVKPINQPITKTVLEFVNNYATVN